MRGLGALRGAVDVNESLYNVELTQADFASIRHEIEDVVKRRRNLHVTGASQLARDLRAWPLAGREAAASAVERAAAWIEGFVSPWRGADAISVRNLCVALHALLASAPEMRSAIAALASDAGVLPARKLTGSRRDAVFRLACDCALALLTAAVGASEEHEAQQVRAGVGADWLSSRIEELRDVIGKVQLLHDSDAATAAIETGGQPGVEVEFECADGVVVRAEATRACAASQTIRDLLESTRADGGSTRVALTDLRAGDVRAVLGLDTAGSALDTVALGDLLRRTSAANFLNAPHALGACARELVARLSGVAQVRAWVVA